MAKENPEALYWRAKDAFDQGDLALASELCDRALQQRRNSFDTLMLAAFAAGKAGRFDAEVGYVARAVRIKPKDAQLRTHLGLCHVRAGQLRQAKTQFENALKISPGFAMAVNGLAKIYERQNKYDRARRFVERYVDGAATPPEVADVHVRLLIHDGELDAAIALGEAVCSAGHAPSDPVRSLYFGLAEAYERAGDTERAFARAKTANGMMALPYAPEQTERLVEATQAAFSSDRMARVPRSTANAEVPVFIVGLPRTGSTLVERILAAHRNVHGAGEMLVIPMLTDDLPRRLSSDLRYPACIADLDAAGVDAIGRDVLEAFTRRAPNAERVTDKCLANFWHLGLIELLLPKARIIDCRRDPVDTCLSCFMSRLLPAEAPYAADLEHLGFHYRKYERIMAHWERVLRLPVLRVHYERLTDEPEPEMRRLLDFCGLPWDENCLAFHRMKREERTLSFDQVRRPIYRSSVGRAERFGALLDPLRRALAGPTTAS